MTFGADTVIDIRSSELTESSGLAVSRRDSTCFWTHNDSGGEAKLFAINTQGEVTGSVTFTDAKAIDWEDIATFQHAGENWIMVADTGDNAAKRDSVTLYFLKEPEPKRHQREAVSCRMQVKYPNGPRDCEAVAIDPKSQQIIFVAKSFLPLAPVYTTSLPDLTVGVSNAKGTLLEYQGTLAIPLVSAMDIDAATGDLILVNYFQCFWFKRDRDSDQNAWIKQLPVVTDLPKLKQIEAVAITSTHEAWVTSEGNPAKLTKLPSVGPGAQ